MTGRWRRFGQSRRMMIGTVVGALLATGSVVWWSRDDAAEDRARCWGAWRPEAEVSFFSDDDHRLEVSETAPTPGRPRGSCSLSWDQGSGQDREHEQVVASYDTAPRDAAARRAWLRTFFGSSGAALPEGLPGFVSRSFAAVVLPEACDANGRPSVVTISGRKAGSGDFVSSLPTGDSLWRTGQLLIELANHGMERAGCAPEKPLAFTTPVYADLNPSADDIEFTPGTCAIAGLGRAAEHDKSTFEQSDLGYRLGPVGPDLQTCLVDYFKEPVAQFTMTARPRLVALFDGLAGATAPGRGWRGTGYVDDTGALVRADCGGRPTVFFTERGGDAATTPGLRSTSRAFPVYVDAAAKRIGCSPVAPRGDRA